MHGIVISFIHQFMTTFLKWVFNLMALAHGVKSLSLLQT